jgi:hypothetical protein
MKKTNLEKLNALATSMRGASNTQDRVTHRITCQREIGGVRHLQLETDKQLSSDIP